MRPLHGPWLRLAFLLSALSLAWGAKPARPATRAEPGAPEWQVRQGLTDRVRSIRWSPAGKQLATQSADGTLVLWDPETGEPGLTLPLARYPQDWTWSRDGTTIAAPETARRLTLWDVATGRRRASVTVETPLREVRWSPDGRRVAAFDEQHAILCNLAAKHPRPIPLPGLAGIRDAAWDPDGRSIAVVAEKAVRVYDRAGKAHRTLAIPETRGVQTVQWSPDGQRIALGFAGSLLLWDPAHAAAQAVHPDSAPGWAEYPPGGYVVAWSPDSRSVAQVTHQREARLYSRSGELQHVLRDPDRVAIDHLTWSPDGRTLATAAGLTTRLWDAATGRLRATLAGPVRDRFSRPTALLPPAWSPDGRTLATALRPETGGGVIVDRVPIRLWNTDSGTLRAELRGHFGAASALAWRPDSSLLASAGEYDRTPILWDGRSGRLYARLPASSTAIEEVTWSPDGALFATLDQAARGVVVWDPREDAPRSILWARGARDAPRVTGFAWSPDSRRIALSEGPFGGSLWDARAGRREQDLGGTEPLPRGLVWSPDGRWLAGTNGFGAQLWDGETGAFRHRLPPAPYGLVDLSWSPDSRLLAGSSYGDVQAATIWDPETGQERRRLAEARWLLSWSPDGKTVATGAAGKPATLLWDVATGGLRATLPGAWRSWWSPDSRTLATYDPEAPGTSFWDARTGQRRVTVPGPALVGMGSGWSADGKWFATGSPGAPPELLLWDARTGERHAALSAHEDEISVVAWSPGGAALATAGLDRQLIVWDAASGRERFRVRNVTAGQVRRIEWSPDGRTLLTLSGDGALSRWRASDGAHLATYFSFDTEDWLALLPGGRVAGTAAGRRHLVARKGNMPTAENDRSSPGVSQR